MVTIFANVTHRSTLPMAADNRISSFVLCYVFSSLSLKSEINFHPGIQNPRTPTSSPSAGKIWIDDRWIKDDYEAMVEWYRQEHTEALGRQLATETVFLTLFPCGPGWDRSCASVGTGAQTSRENLSSWGSNWWFNHS